MKFVLQPWQLFFLILSGWVNRQQQEMIEFQNAQIPYCPKTRIVAISCCIPVGGSEVGRQAAPLKGQETCRPWRPLAGFAGRDGRCLAIAGAVVRLSASSEVTERKGNAGRRLAWVG